MKSLETERLLLEMWSIDDAKELYEYAKNPNVGPPAGWKPHENVEESTEIIKTIFLPNEAWAIHDKASKKVIGCISFEADRFRPKARSKELGYNLAENYWGKGIMTEAAKEVMRFGFEELDLEIISICTSEKNLRSQSVIKKCGFIYEGTIRKTYKIYDGTLRDSRVYSILKNEWKEV